MSIIHLDKVWDDILLALTKEVFAVEIKSIKFKVDAEMTKGLNSPSIVSMLS